MTADGSKWLIQRPCGADRESVWARGAKVMGAEHAELESGRRIWAL